MTTLAITLKKEISRLARKELRAEIALLRKHSASYRSEIAALKRRIEVLEKRPGAQSNKRKVTGDETELASASTKKPRTRSFEARDLLGFRKHHELTQTQVAQLLGVSTLSVYKWESGKVTPRAAQIDRIGSMMKLGKRAIKAQLAS